MMLSFRPAFFVFDGMIDDDTFSLKNITDDVFVASKSFCKLIGQDAA